MIYTMMCSMHAYYGQECFIQSMYACTEGVLPLTDSVLRFQSLGCLVGGGLVVVKIIRG